MTTSNTIEIAAKYIAAGLSVLPLRLDGSKSPAVASWQAYQRRLPTDAEIAEWFRRPAGIAIVTGRISRGLEVIDFDQPELFEPWRELTKGIHDHLPVVKTGSGGFHVFYRCRQIAGNAKLATWEPPDCHSDRKAGTRRGCGRKPIKATRIETRGDGGYIVACGSPVEVHASEAPYIQVSGPVLPEIPAITPMARRALWEAAATFDCGRSESAKVRQKMREIKRERWQSRSAIRSVGDVTPWDDFDQRADWSTILEPHGWTTVGGGRWTRPGKRFGTSATIGPNDKGEKILTVFSSNAGSLSPGSYGAFRAFAALNHGGDGMAAGKAVAELGYGTHATRRTS